MREFIKHESMYLGKCGYEAVLLRQYQTNKCINKNIISTTPDPQVEIAILSKPFQCKTLKEKLIWIWYILWNNSIWSDQVILDGEEMEKLGKDLLSIASEINKKTKNSKKHSI